MTYRLTRRAERDIEDIHVRGTDLFGADQADRYQNGLRAVFDVLASHPRLARQRHEFRRPVRLHPYRAHLIVYVEDASGVLIVRILHGRQDWAERLRL